MDAAQRQRLGQFVIAELTRDEAAFRRDVTQAVEALLATPLAELLDPERVEASIRAALAAEGLVRDTHLGVVRAARAERTTFGTFVPESARARIDALLTKKRMLNETLLRQVLEHEAMEETLRDVIFDALKEFNERFNPFVADWGLPGLLKRIGPFGLGPLAKSVENVRAEFDRRLEPEMRKFLQGFSRRAVRQMADLVVEKADDPKFVALRRSLVAWLYDQEVRELVRTLDDESVALWSAISVGVANHALLLDASVARRRGAITSLLRAHGREPLGAVLRAHGLDPQLDAEAIARALWPAARAVFLAPFARERVARILDAFFASEANEEPAGGPSDGGGKEGP